MKIIRKLVKEGFPALTVLKDGGEYVVKFGNKEWDRFDVEDKINYKFLLGEIDLKERKGWENAIYDSNRPNTDI